LRKQIATLNMPPETTETTETTETHHPAKWKACAHRPKRKQGGSRHPPASQNVDSPEPSPSTEDKLQEEEPSYIEITGGIFPDYEAEVRELSERWKKPVDAAFIASQGLKRYVDR
jgi:hypothetical protein